MINTQAILRSLPLVASVLGRKYGVNVEIGGTEAYTNGNTIHLPALPSDMPDTFLALARGYLDHESAHIRETDFEALRQAELSPLETHVWNTIEDWRVENKLAAIFPGCRGNFDWLIRHVFGSEQPDISNPTAIIILNWLLLHIRAWDVQELCANRDRLAAQLDIRYPGVRPSVESILESVRRSCDSTVEAIDYARQIVSALQQAATQDPGEPGSTDADEDGAPPPHDDNNGPGERRPSEVGNDVPTNSEHCSNAVLTELARQELGSLLEHLEDELPSSLGTILSSTLEDASQHSASQNSIAVAVRTGKQSGPLHDDDIRESARASVTLRTRMHGLLQTAIEIRSALGRKGRLEATALHRLAVSDPRVFRRKKNRQGIDTAVQILLDCSGSMIRNIHLACMTCYTVANALQTMNINVAVTAFPADPLPDGSYTTVAPIVRHGQRLHTNFTLGAAGGTPMGEALWWTLQDMLMLSEHRKIILIVTDGSPDSLDCALMAIRVAKASGFEVYGIGIGSDAVSQLLPHKCRTIHDLSALSPAMFELLQHALTDK